MRLTSSDSIWGLAARTSSDPEAWQATPGRFGHLSETRGHAPDIRAGDLLLPYRSVLTPVPRLRPTGPEGYRLVRFPIRPPSGLPKPIPWFSAQVTGQAPATDIVLGSPADSDTPRVLSLYPASRPVEPGDLVPVDALTGQESGRQWQVVRPLTPNNRGLSVHAYQVLAKGQVVAQSGAATMVRLENVSGPVRPGDFLLPAFQPRFREVLQRPEFRPETVSGVTVRPYAELHRASAASGLLVLEAGDEQGVRPGGLYRVWEPSFVRHDPLRNRSVRYPEQRTGLLLTLGVYPTASLAIMLNGEPPRSDSVTLRPFR